MLCIAIHKPMQAQATDSLAQQYPVIPTPQEIVYGEKRIFFSSFAIDASTVFKAETDLWSDFLVDQGLIPAKDGLVFRFLYEPSHHNRQESYTLKLDTAVTLSAGSPDGIFYGIQSLKQLFRKVSDKGALPQVRIADWPSFSMRGFMHDTGRNFQSVTQLKEQIEVLAGYKFNVFHWHLTDNPGWRLESLKYPQLQSAASFSRDIGQYYTQQDFKEILAFCRERHITVIPEFDIPGHTAAFRRAFGFETMREPEVLPILQELFEELMQLADAEQMPYIHIGTDEVRDREEAVPDSVIRSIMKRIQAAGREVIVWKEGIRIDGDSVSIQQLWARHPPTVGQRYIDSRANYINHLDPLAGMVRLFFQQPCRQPQGDSLALGGTLCAWPDNDVAEQRDILGQNPIYPAIVFYSDAIWKGKSANYEAYWAKLPPGGSPELQAFREFENKVLVHRDAFFKGKEFPYVRHSNIPWQLIGPFDHGGEVRMSFPVEKGIKKSYGVGGKTYAWQGPVYGGTIHLSHFFDFPSLTEAKSGTFYARSRIFSPEDRQQEFWIGFHGWSRAGGRRGGPTPKWGQWHHTEPKIWVNARMIPPPEWQQPGLGAQTDEIPFMDEDYFYRAPTIVTLKKGWNDILLKIPHHAPSWKWMFTCVPISRNKEGVREAQGLEYETDLNPIRP